MKFKLYHKETGESQIIRGDNAVNALIKHFGRQTFDHKVFCQPGENCVHVAHEIEEPGGPCNRILACDYYRLTEVRGDE